MPQAAPRTCAAAPPASSLPGRAHALSWPACPVAQPLQVAKPEEMELGKPLARRGLEVGGVLPRLRQARKTLCMRLRWGAPVASVAPSVLAAHAPSQSLW